MKAVADTVGVARSNLVERLGRVPGARRPYTKPADRALRCSMSARAMDIDA